MALVRHVAELINNKGLLVMFKDRVGIVLLGICMAIAMGMVFYNSMLS
jgi:hypothetical protein